MRKRAALEIAKYRIENNRNNYIDEEEQLILADAVIQSSIELKREKQHYERLVRAIRKAEVVIKLAVQNYHGGENMKHEGREWLEEYGSVE